MKSIILFTLVLLFAMPSCRGQEQAMLSAQLLDKIIKRERAVTEDLQALHPLVETYIQNFKMQDGRYLPMRDHYFLSIADFHGQLRAVRFMPRGLTLSRNLEEHLDAVVPNSLEFEPSGFVAMAYPDQSTFDLHHYRFELVKEELLDGLPCLVLDVYPVPMRKLGLFEGRIWVEKQKLTIVRFKGIFLGSNFSSKYFHFDSWRTQVAPDLWIPSVIYSGEMNLPCCGIGRLNWSKLHFKAQTRFWGYNIQQGSSAEILTRVVLQDSSEMRDESSDSPDRQPIEQQKAWDLQAEDNVTEQLERTGLLAPRGEVDERLEAIVRSFESENHPAPLPEVRCRVMLTSKLESAIVGHTVILSVGLLDVLPDESTLAAVLAHGVAVAALQDSRVREFAFADNLHFPVQNTDRNLRFTHSERQREIASALAAEWLEHSPYRGAENSLAVFTAGMLRERIPMSNLLDPSFGDGAITSVNIEKKPNKRAFLATSGQTLGSRLLINPWNDEVRFVTTDETVGSRGATENNPFPLRSPVAKAPAFSFELRIYPAEFE